MTGGAGGGKVNCSVTGIVVEALPCWEQTVSLLGLQAASSARPCGHTLHDTQKKLLPSLKVSLFLQGLVEGSCQLPSSLKPQFGVTPNPGGTEVTQGTQCVPFQLVLRSL